MVHALRETHRLLRPNGLLVDIHGLPTPHVIEVHSPEKVDKVGWLLDRDDFENERFAFNALAQSVVDGHFILEDERDFTHNVYLDSLDEFQQWLAEWWTSAILPQGTISRIEELLRHAGGSARIMLAWRARMTKLRAA